MVNKITKTEIKHKHFGNNYGKYALHRKCYYLCRSWRNCSGGNVHDHTTVGTGLTANSYGDSCIDGKQPSQIVATLTESVATLTRELKSRGDS